MGSLLRDWLTHPVQPAFADRVIPVDTRQRFNTRGSTCRTGGQDAIG
jgi:hypothetical protein